MNFNTANSTFRQLLGNGLSYCVPPFQRDYSWTEDEWDDLWQDILALYEDDGESAHYMGYLVLQSSDSKKFDIIDGQQRLTTISTLILAGLSLLKDLIKNGVDADDNTRRKEQLQNSYIGYVDPVTLVAQTKLKLNRNNNNFYQTYMVTLDTLPRRNLKSSEQQLRKAFEWFKDKIKSRKKTVPLSGMEIAKFIDTLVDKLFFTVITVTDELNAFKVFETLNARGVRLSATDLLKNYLFSVINTRETHESELKNLEERWERIVGMLENESFPEFLRVFWNSRNRLVRKSDLFKTIRNRITNKDGAFALLRDLDHSAEIYSALRDSGDSSWNREEKECLERLSMFKVRQPLAMLLACHERFFNADRNAFTRILRAITIVSFRYNVICNLQTSEQERLYNEIARDVFSGKHSRVGDVLKGLENVYPDDNQFKAVFTQKELRTNDSRNKKIVRWILFEIERQVSGKSFEFESATYDLEHILPEHPSESWAYIEEPRQERLIYRIGNITPLETVKNREIGNWDYASKRSEYEKSDFQITRAIAEHYDSWDEQKIESRQRQLAKTAAAIWKIEF